MIDSRSFRQIMGCFATGITVATVRDKKKNPIGITINSLTSVSLKPPLILFCLDRAAHVYPLFKQSKFFAFNILGEQQKDISNYFADYNRFTKPEKMWDRAQMCCPILLDTLGWMICKKTKIHRAGDHDIFVAEVVKVKKNGGHGEPLLYFHSRYRQIAE